LAVTSVGPRVFWIPPDGATRMRNCRGTPPRAERSPPCQKPHSSSGGMASRSPMQPHADAAARRRRQSELGGQLARDLAAGRPSALAARSGAPRRGRDVTDPAAGHPAPQTAAHGEWRRRCACHRPRCRPAVPGSVRPMPPSGYEGRPWAANRKPPCRREVRVLEVRRRGAGSEACGGWLLAAAVSMRRAARSTAARPHSALPSTGTAPRRARVGAFRGGCHHRPAPPARCHSGNAANQTT
jgi:hypothetical protein